MSFLALLEVFFDLSGLSPHTIQLHLLLLHLPSDSLASHCCVLTAELLSEPRYLNWRSLGRLRLWFADSLERVNLTSTKATRQTMLPVVTEEKSNTAASSKITLVSMRRSQRLSAKRRQMMLPAITLKKVEIKLRKTEEEPN